MAIALENAKLFDDVQKMKNYNDSMLQSMSNGVVTLDGAGRIVTCNASGCRIMKLASAEVVGHDAGEFFVGKNAWVMERIEHVRSSQEVAVAMDAEFESLKEPIPKFMKIGFFMKTIAAFGIYKIRGRRPVRIVLKKDDLATRATL